MAGYSNPSLEFSAADLVPIALDTDLDPVITALRVSNPTTAWVNVSVVTLKGPTRVLDFPPSSLTTETVRITRINLTGTSPGVGLMGYLSA